MITYKPVSNFRTDDHKTVLARIAELNAKGRTLRGKRDSINKSIDNDESSDPNLKTRLSDLISGRSPTPPTPWGVQLHAVQIEIRDNEDDLDFLAAKAKIFETEAGRRMVEDAGPQILAAERAKFDAFVALYEKFVPVWAAKRELLNNSVGTYGLFSDEIDEVMGVPTDLNSRWADVFRDGVAKGHIRKMPTALLPKR